MEQTGIEMPAKVPQGINGTMRGAHVGLRTPDFESTIEWYTEKLGFRVLKKWTVGTLRLAFLAPANDDSFWLEVLCDGTSNPEPNSAPPVSRGYHHFCLDVDDVDATLAALRERGVTVFREPFDVPPIGKRCGFIADLHGNIIELAANLG
jgi:lactoylglutathione lyase